MLADICLAVEMAVGYLRAGDSERARQTISQYPQVLTSCDELNFQDPGQAIAYLILHLADRFSRMFQVLERLLLSGSLPLGRNEGFAAIDIGAGPGPGIFAIRSFYATLAHYARVNDPDWPIATLGHAHVVERNNAMPWVMHNLAEVLMLVEQGKMDLLGSEQPREPNPCIHELEQSGPPFGAQYADFSALDVRAEHQQARQRLACQLTNDDWWGLSPAEVNQIAYHDPIDTPSSYALVVMMNFLTATNVIPSFSKAIERLMRGSLVPGGVILVLGAIGADYRKIYAELDQRARAAHLTVLDGFEDPLQAGGLEDELAMLRTLTRTMWNSLAELAGDISQTKDELRQVGVADIFDESIPFSLPQFRVRAYRRGR